MTAGSDEPRSILGKRLRSNIVLEDGYALPSILMLVTILSLVAYSVLALEYLERKSALLDVARIKAEHAAQSGIVCMASEIQVGSLTGSVREFSLYDGSRAFVRVVPWGALYLIESRGVVGKVTATRRATLGARPGKAFSLALSLGNTSHQLILTGDASIIGDVAVGPAGVSTGQLHGYPTPPFVPIQGKVTNLAARDVPEVNTERIRFIANYYRNMLEGIGQSTEMRGSASSSFTTHPDSLRSIVIPPGSVITDSIARPYERLYILCRGNVIVSPRARLVGLITIVSTDSILIESGANNSGCVLVAEKGIRARGSFLSSVQFISPKIVLESGCQVKYPSIVLSIPLDPGAPSTQSLVISKNVNIEGFVGMFSPRGDDVLDLELGSHVLGAVFSSARLSLDGDLIGSASTSDLFFYEAPRSYFGWKRAGKIDRPKLPEAFLTAPIFAGNLEISVLEWL